MHFMKGLISRLTSGHAGLRYALFGLGFLISGQIIGITNNEIALKSDPICAPIEPTGNCLNDLAQFNNPTCSSSDVETAAFNVIAGPTSCVAGTTIEVELQAETVSTASERYNVGYFIALDGGDAKTGTCYDDYLPPPLSTTATPSGNMRTSPFFDGNSDLCGDLEKNVINLRNIGGTTVSSGPQGPPIMLTLPCQDSDGDGNADVNACTSWTNNKNHNTCTSVAGTVPETPSMCNCGPIQLGTITVTGCTSPSDCPNADLCQTASCVSGVCVYTPVDCTPLDQCHLAGVCNSQTGLCSNPAKPDDSPCDTGNACFTNDTCQGGVCTNGTPVTCPDIICKINNGCLNGACNYTNVPDGTPCDGNGFTCQSGMCVPPSHPCVHDSDCINVECQTARCVSEQCVYSVAPDGTRCGADDVCNDGTCVECNVAGDCPDGDVCNVVTCTITHTCNYTLKDCSGGGTNCTIDCCDPIANPDTGCV